MRRLSWTPRAQRDILAIDAWLTANADADVAVRMLRSIRDAARILRDFPEIGAPGEALAFRKWRVRDTPYLLAYRFVLDEVQVLRVRHVREDWQSDMAGRS